MPGPLSRRAPPSTHGGLFTLAAFALLACAPADPPRGIVLVSIDTLRAGHLGSYGYPRDTSPTLDRLAAGGVLCEAATAPAAWTVPSHASLLTGLYPRSHGMRTTRDRMPDDVQTLASLLREQGWATGAVVNVRLLSRRQGFDRGFDAYHRVPVGLGREKAAHGVSRRALEWLDSLDGEPFFLFLHYYDVHSGYGASPRYEALFADSYDGPFDGSTRQLKEVRKGLLPLGPEDLRHVVNLYDAGIRQLDAAIADLLESLGRGGYLDRAVLVVTSDHGEEFLEHGSVLHGRTLHQELVHVPLIFWGHGVPQGVRLSEPVSLVDVAPTLLSRLGIDPPPDLDGVDLSTSWSAPGDAWPFSPADDPRAIFSEADRWIGGAPGQFRRAVRMGDHTLHYDSRSGRFALYDVSADPYEHRDLVDREPAIARDLRDALQEFGRRRPTEAVPLPDLPPETLEQLRQLGYVE